MLANTTEQTHLSHSRVMYSTGNILSGIGLEAWCEILKLARVAAGSGMPWLFPGPFLSHIHSKSDEKGFLRHDKDQVCDWDSEQPLRSEPTKHARKLFLEDRSFHCVLSCVEPAGLINLKPFTTAHPADVTASKKKRKTRRYFEVRLSPCKASPGNRGILQGHSVRIIHCSLNLLVHCTSRVIPALRPVPPGSPSFHSHILEIHHARRPTIGPGSFVLAVNVDWVENNMTIPPPA